MKKAVVIVLAALAAFFALAGIYLLAGSLITRFSPLPTEFENSEWISEDGAFRLLVKEYDESVYQCRAEIIYTFDGGEASYEVADAANGTLSVYADPAAADSWLRTKCSKEKFTVRINRTAKLDYSESYEQGEKVTFTRVK